MEVLSMTSPVEYGTYPPEQRSVVTVPFQGPCYKPGFNGLIVRLEHYTAGYEPAGAMARWTDEGWAVRWTMNHARHGQRYRTFDEARAHFERLCCSNG
jgi:hypothetical protein